MTGSFSAYHMRQNKAVDRALFVELLKLIGSHPDIDFSKYEYIGMGGPYLEDFKIMHTYFNFQKMTSIEMSEKTYLRQKINKPFSCIDLKKIRSGDFIDSYQLRELNFNSVAWLDFMTRKEITEQIWEFTALLRSSNANDILRLTVNATNPKSESKLPQAKDGFKELIKDEQLCLSPEDYPDNFLTAPGYAEAVLKVIFNGLSTVHTKKFIPLMVLRYNDSSQQMLTLTGIVFENDISKEPAVQNDEEQEFLMKAKIKDWQWYYGKTNAITYVNIPSFSTNEKALIDRKLPTGALAEKYKRMFADEDSVSEKLVSNYVDLYRFAPVFARIFS